MMKSIQLVFIYISLISPLSIYSQSHVKCFEKIEIYEEETWRCRYFPENIERDDLITYITEELERAIRNTDDFYIRNNNQNNSVYIQTSNKKIVDFIESNLSEWDSTDRIITTLTPLNIKIDYYVLEENETSGFRGGISQIQKVVTNELEGNSIGEELTTKALDILVTGGTSGLGAVLSKGLDNFSIYLGNKRQKNLMRHHKTYNFDNSDRDWFELSELAPMDITSPNNISDPQIIDVGVRVSGRMQLNGGKNSKLLYVPQINFEWTRISNLENKILPTFKYERSDSNWILGVPKLIATSEVNEFTNSKSSDLLSIDNEKNSNRKKLAIVVTVYKADDPSQNPLIDYELPQSKVILNEEVLQLPNDKTDCDQIEKSIQLKVVRDNFGKAKLMLNFSPDVLTKRNFNEVIKIETTKKGARKWKDIKRSILKDIAYFPQTIYEVIPEKEGENFIELKMSFRLEEDDQLCKFKLKAEYNLDNGDFRLK